MYTRYFYQIDQLFHCLAIIKRYSLLKKIILAGYFLSCPWYHEVLRQVNNVEQGEDQQSHVSVL